MTYSQGPGAGTHPTTAATSQKIYFATSDDLNIWKKTDTVFETDVSQYNVAEGAWDCIATLPGDDGSLFGYFFADAKQTQSVGSGVKGGGFAHSVNPLAGSLQPAHFVSQPSLLLQVDGLHWNALPSVSGSASSVFRFGPRIWLTSAGRLTGPASSPKGPFNSNGVNDRGKLVEMGFGKFTSNSPLLVVSRSFLRDFLCM